MVVINEVRVFEEARSGGCEEIMVEVEMLVWKRWLR